MFKTKLSRLTVIGGCILLCAVLVTGCADPNNVQQCISGHTYGFWGGLWHGMIAPFAFIGSLCSDDIAVWAPNNNGGWYAFGFLLGIGTSVKGSRKITYRKTSHYHEDD